MFSSVIHYNFIEFIALFTSAYNNSDLENALLAANFSVKVKKKKEVITMNDTIINKTVDLVSDVSDLNQANSLNNKFCDRNVTGGIKPQCC